MPTRVARGEMRSFLPVVRGRCSFRRSVEIWYSDARIRRSPCRDWLLRLFGSFVVFLHSRRSRDASTKQRISVDARVVSVFRGYIYLKFGSKFRRMRTARIDQHRRSVRRRSITAVHTMTLHKFAGMRICPEMIGCFHTCKFQCTGTH